jgi:hypothetical protein
MPERCHLEGARRTRRPAVLLAATFGLAASVAATSALRLELERPPAVVRPLEEVAVTVRGTGHVSVVDGRGREYVHVPAAGRVRFVAGGAAGPQSVRLVDAGGQVVASAGFRLEARTGIEDAGGRMEQLLGLGRRTLERPNDSGTPTGVGTLDWRGRTWRYYVPWLRDHVHTMKGFKYFDGTGADALDFFRETQREDGIIWDFFAQDPNPTFFETAYGPLGYARRYDGLSLVRMPVEADVEYLFVEGVYYAWKANADDAWMRRQLDAAVKALDYSVTDRARFSSKYGLVKRAYSIDTWDFQVDDPSTRLFPRWSSLLVDPDRTPFGVMFGDNTGYAASCGYLAEMLDRAGRVADAARFRQRAADVRARLDRVSWLDTHFRHWVAEDETTVRDLGVDERAQVSLSNTYSLNRGISHAQAAAILRTYQELRGALPPGSPGEWYAIYPPFAKGFGDHSAPWQYVNGGVSPIFAGELARGAFEHGFEAYGADILGRVLDLAKSSGDRVWFAYTGAYPPRPEPRFTTVDLSAHATMDLGGRGAEGVPRWMAAEPDDHLGNLPTGRQTLAGVPFLVTDPAANGRRAAIAVAHRPGFLERVEVPVGAKTGAIYVLHSVGGAGNLKVAGAITFQYDDGTSATQYVVQDRNVSGWWFPSLDASWPGGYGSPRQPPLVALAWRGRSDVCPNVGIYWYGLDNPHPDRIVHSIAFSSTLDGAIYAVAGLTLADQPLDQPPPRVSFGGPDNWAAGAVIYGLVEGLAGVVDRDVAYRVAGVAPRWTAADTKEAKVVVQYPASGGYVAYDYRHDPSRRRIQITITGSGDRAECHVLLPAGTAAPVGVTDGSTPVAFTTSSIEGSVYADFAVALDQVKVLTVRY